MSDYYEEDSFESESDPESVEREEERRDSRLQDPRVWEVQQISGLISSGLGSNGGSNSDAEEQELSRVRSTKSERSPKPPRKKFRVKKPNIGSFTPNIGSFTQKLRNKLKKDSAIFGAPLEIAVQRSQLGTDQIELPTPFRQCIDFLEEHGMDHQGIYRLPGVKSKVEELKSHFDKGEVVDLTDQDPNTVASVLKLYLRELPEPLIPHHRLSGKMETLSDISSDQQLLVLKEVVDDLPGPNYLLLSWLLEHTTHIIAKSSVNKMTLPNMVIVFSPTLQLPAHFLHTLYNHSRALFGEVELKRYEKPAVRKGSAKIDLANVDLLVTEQDVSSELERLNSLLMKLHSKVAGRFDSREEDMWKLQRNITDLRRKKKAIQKSNQDVMREAEEGISHVFEHLPLASDFMRTLLLMEATLKAENEELMERKQQLQEAIKKEADMIDQYKEELKRYTRTERRTPSSDEESGDEADLAKKIATLKWHEKEMEMRNKNLVQSIIEEDEAILNLKVKLKVLPLSKELQVEDQD